MYCIKFSSQESFNTDHNCLIWKNLVVPELYYMRHGYIHMDRVSSRFWKCYWYLQILTATTNTCLKGKMGFEGLSLMQWTSFVDKFKLHKQLSLLWISGSEGLVSDKSSESVAFNSHLGASAVLILGPATLVIRNYAREFGRVRIFSFFLLFPFSSASKHVCSGCFHAHIQGCRRN